MMPSRRAAPDWRKDEAAVSSVLGAILLFGLLIVTLVRIRVEFVPVWDHDHEADHASEIASEIAQVKTDLDRQVANQTSASISDPMRLGWGGGFTFFSNPDQPGTLSFTPGPAGSGFTLASNQLTLESRDGVGLGGLQAYSGLVSGQSASNVVGISSLLFRLDNPMATITSGPMTLRMDMNSAGNCQAQLIVAISTDAINSRPRNIEIQTYAPYSGACVAVPGNAPVHLRDALIGCASPCVSPSQFYFDALDPELQLQAVLASAITPFTVTFTLGGTPALQASAVFSYDQSVAGGTNHVGGGGLVSPNYSSLLSVGTLSLNKNNQRFADQTYLIEYGAVILVQDGIPAMAIPPVFSINTTATQATLDITLPALTGTPNQVGGSPAATVTSTPQGQRGSVTGLAPRITITLTTAYPQLWATYWDNLFTTAGFTSGTHYVITTPVGSGTASITFYGPTSAPNDLSTNDLAIRLQTSPLALDLRATG
jgi:hypothetical protein